MAIPNDLGVTELPFSAFRLSNGLRVRLIPLPHLQTATIGCFIRVGSRYESVETNGLSHFLEHMVYRGTERHPAAHDLSLAIEGLGGTLEAATHVDFTSYDLTLPSETLESGVDVFAEVLLRPLLNAMGTEKQIIREEILEDLNEHGDEIDIDNLSRRLLYPDHSLGFSIPGPLENLERFDFPDLRMHHAFHYSANNSVVCVAGSFDENRVADLLTAAFEGMTAGTETKAVSPSPEQTGARAFEYVHEPGSQTDIRLCFHVPGVGSPMAPAFLLLERILDDGLSTRIHRVVCEERGLAYDAFAGIDSYEDCGVFEIGASVEHRKAPRLVETALELVRDLRETPPSPDEIQKAKNRYLWNLRTVRDDPEATTHFVGTSALFSLPERIEAAAEQVSAVTADDLQRAAHTYLDPSKAFVTCVGALDGGLEAAVEGLIDN